MVVTVFYIEILQRLVVGIGMLLVLGLRDTIVSGVRRRIKGLLVVVVQ